MGLLDMLQSDDDRRDYGEFADRYDRGAPWDGFDEREAYDRHDRISRHLSPEEYEMSARGALERLSPMERRQLGRHLRDESRRRGFEFDRDCDGVDDRYEDSGHLSGLMGGFQRRQSGMYGDLI